MLNKKSKGEGNLNTIIGKGTILEGTLEVSGGVRIDGKVKGKISCNETISIGDEGVVESDLDAKIIIIGGDVQGNVFASEKVELQSKSKVTGDITTKSLVVAEGAVFHGKSNMLEEGVDNEKREF